MKRTANLAGLQGFSARRAWIPIPHPFLRAGRHPAIEWPQVSTLASVSRPDAGYATDVSDDTVTFPVDHPSIQHGAAYLQKADLVVVFFVEDANEEIMDVVVVDAGDGSATLKFPSTDDAARFSEALRAGVQMMVPLHHREGLVPQYTQGVARGKSIDELRGESR